MEKDFRYVELFELYQQLLTKKQREMFSSHYLYDLSLAEIAEPEGSTRQNVYSAIKKVKQKLDEYESHLHLFEKNVKLTEIAEQIKSCDIELSNKIKEIIGR